MESGDEMFIENHHCPVNFGITYEITFGKFTAPGGSVLHFTSLRSE
jgi:hypothetical protein